MKKALLIVVGVACVSYVGAAILANSLIQSDKKGKIHDHPWIKGICWVTAKRMTRDFDPDTVSWSK